MIYLGIDPGKTGALTCINGSLITIFDYGDPEIYKLLRKIYDEKWLLPAFATLERVSSRPGEGVTSSFNFGANYGGWKTILEFLGIPFIEPTPRSWQKVLFKDVPLITKTKNVYLYETKGKKRVKIKNPDPAKGSKYLTEPKIVTDTKAMSFKVCRRLFDNPSQKYLTLQKHDGRADSLLIAEYGRRTKL